MQAAENSSAAVSLSPFAVILSAAKNLALPLRVDYAKDLALCIFTALRDSSFVMLRTANGSSERQFRRVIPQPIEPRPCGTHRYRNWPLTSLPTQAQWRRGGMSSR